MKVLLISLGSIGKRHLKNTRVLLPEAEIAVFRQKNTGDKEIPNGADKVFFDLADCLEFEPNAIIISSPASYHIDNIKPFLNLNCSIFIEKPLSNTSDNLDKFCQLVKESNNFVMTGYVLRFHPALHKIKSLIKSNELGKVLQANVQVGQYLPDWRPNSDYREGVSGKSSLGGGALLELSHEIDYSQWLFGEPDNIYCCASKLSDLEIDVEDSAHMFLQYGKKDLEKIVTVQLDFLQRVPQMSVQIVGTNATLKSNLINETITLYTQDNPNGKNINFKQSIDGNEIYLKQFDFFFKKAFANYKNVYTESVNFNDWVDIDSAAKVINLVDLLKQSNKLGKKLEVGCDIYDTK